MSEHRTNDQRTEPAAAWRERAFAAALGLISIVAGVLVRSGTLPPFWAKYAGVALWSALVYWLVLFVMPRAPVARACIWAIGIGWAVELLQLTPGPAKLAAVFPLSRWVLGTTFHAPDLAAYVVGAVAATGMHWAMRRAGWWRRV